MKTYSGRSSRLAKISSSAAFESVVHNFTVVLSEEISATTTSLGDSLFAKEPKLPRRLSSAVMPDWFDILAGAIEQAGCAALD